MTVTDALNRQTVVVSDLSKGRPTSVTDPLSRQTQYAYDSARRPFARQPADRRARGAGASLSAQPELKARASNALPWKRAGPRQKRILTGAFAGGDLREAVWTAKLEPGRAPRARRATE
jgi:YD repeat-containing protein